MNQSCILHGGLPDAYHEGMRLNPDQSPAESSEGAEEIARATKTTVISLVVNIILPITTFAVALGLGCGTNNKPGQSPPLILVPELDTTPTVPHRIDPLMIPELAPVDEPRFPPMPPSGVI